ncbi:MAG: molybdopterin molybdotransferase MoeA, partial [Chitinophagaceae bacterium]
MPIRRTVTIPLHEASNRVLAKSILAPFSLPYFRQSSVDGYALLKESLEEAIPLKIFYHSAAGNQKAIELKNGEVCRVFTGAPIPINANLVLMQEWVDRKGDELVLTDRVQLNNAFIREIGSDIQKGAVAMPEGSIISPSVTGFLASMGISQIAVYDLPKIHIVVTGNEIKEPGTALTFGEVYDANTSMLKAVLQQMGIQSVVCSKVTDNLEATIHQIKEAANNADLVLISGGVSVGDFDFVPKAVNEAGFQTLFHKIKQRPGKPLLAAYKEGCSLFGLPGNPSSVLTCFYLYVAPLLAAMLHQPNKCWSVQQATLLQTVKTPANLTCFLKAQLLPNGVLPLTAQASYQMSDFALANALIEVLEGIEV